MVGLPDGFMRRVGAAARDEGVVAGRGGRAARARAGRPLAARPRARLRPVGAARRARACPRPWVLVASLSYRRRCAPASTTAASPSSWRSGSGEAPASPVCSMVTPHRSRRAQARLHAGLAPRPAEAARGAPPAPRPGPARQGAEPAAAARAALDLGRRLRREEEDRQRRRPEAGQRAVRRRARRRRAGAGAAADLHRDRRRPRVLPRGGPAARGAGGAVLIVVSFAFQQVRRVLLMEYFLALLELGRSLSTGPRQRDMK